MYQAVAEQKRGSFVARNRVILAACALLALCGVGALYGQAGSAQDVAGVAEGYEVIGDRKQMVDADTEHELQPWGAVGSDGYGGSNNYRWSFEFKVGAAEVSKSFPICTLAVGGGGAIGFHHFADGSVLLSWWGKCMVQSEPVTADEWHRFDFYVMGDGRCAGTADGAVMAYYADTEPRQTTETSETGTFYCKYSIGDTSTTAYIRDFYKEQFSGDFPGNLGVSLCNDELDSANADLAACEASLAEATDFSSLSFAGPTDVERGNRLGVFSMDGGFHAEFTLSLSADAACSRSQRDDGCNIFEIGDWLPIGVRQWFDTRKFAIYYYDKDTRVSQWWYFTTAACDYVATKCWTQAEDVADGDHAVVLDYSADGTLTATMDGVEWVTVGGQNAKTVRDKEPIYASHFERKGVVTGITVSNVEVTAA